MRHGDKVVRYPMKTEFANTTTTTTTTPATNLLKIRKIAKINIF